jgi:cytochrome c553
MRSSLTAVSVLLATLFFASASLCADDDAAGVAFFEKEIRPILVTHCYECHSEAAKEQQGGLLLDRRSGWLKGGNTQKAVVPGEVESSLLITAVRYKDEDLQMPPEKPLAAEDVRLLEAWVRRGAPGPATDLGDSSFSRLGDQDWLFEKAKTHWAFQPVVAHAPPEVSDFLWNKKPVDRAIFARLERAKLTPSPSAEARTFIRRLTYDLTGLPPTFQEVLRFYKYSGLQTRESVVEEAVDRLIESPAFGEHFARLWLDVARYADTDSFYRPDTRTPHYFPFAFTYRDYVIDALNSDKPFDQFVREQLAADLLGLPDDAPELAALGFLTVGPHANRNQAEALDDWIDVTTRGLLGLTAACARCHDHKYEPIPTADYYSLRGVFSSVQRINPLKEDQLPTPRGYEIDEADRADYEKKRAPIDKKIADAGNKKSGGNNRSVAQKICETELAELLLFHPGAPVHTMIVKELKRPQEPVVFLRGDAGSRGPAVPRRFLKVLDEEQSPFPTSSSGRLELADKIVDPKNPLTARVFVNRVWGFLMGSHLVATPSDFGLQGDPPTHPELLDWLAADFMANGWSVKHLVRTIVLSRTYRQSSSHREDMAALDPTNRLLWRAQRKHLSIEQLRDSLLAVSGQLDRTMRGRPSQLWGEDYTKRRTIYGYINRFNLDPTLRVFDFPTPMQTQPGRDESIVAPQSLFILNSRIVIDQSIALTDSEEFSSSDLDDSDRVIFLYEAILQREAWNLEVERIVKFVDQQKRFFPSPKSKMKSPWPLVAQALMMSNEFQYLD